MDLLQILSKGEREVIQVEIPIEELISPEQLEKLKTVAQENEKAQQEAECYHERTG